MSRSWVAAITGCAIGALLIGVALPAAVPEDDTVTAAVVIPGASASTGEIPPGETAMTVPAAPGTDARSPGAPAPQSNATTAAPRTTPAAQANEPGVSP